MCLVIVISRQVHVPISRTTLAGSTHSPFVTHSNSSACCFLQVNKSFSCFHPKYETAITGKLYMFVIYPLTYPDKQIIKKHQTKLVWVPCLNTNLIVLKQ